MGRIFSKTNSKSSISFLSASIKSHPVLILNNSESKHLQSFADTCGVINRKFIMNIDKNLSFRD